jgi:low temperature requirement protein LtrA
MSFTSHHPPQRFHVPMRGRDRSEAHRVATPLELFFDLSFVVAVAAAAAALHHELAAGHVVDGVVTYVMVFFAIWWAWMNFTWFASAFDCDVAIVLVLAAAFLATISLPLAILTIGVVVATVVAVTAYRGARLVSRAAVEGSQSSAHPS